MSTENPNSGFGGSTPPQGADDLQGILVVVSFCAPIVGLILWGMNKDQYPNKAKKAVTAAIAGIVFWFVINVILRVALN
jgi:zinc transporter ZupT